MMVAALLQIGIPAGFVLESRVFRICGCQCAERVSGRESLVHVVGEFLAA